MPHAAGRGVYARPCCLTQPGRAAVARGCRHCRMMVVRVLLGHQADVPLPALLLTRLSARAPVPQDIQRFYNTVIEELPSNVADLI